MSYDLVIFDCDGVLVDSEIIYHRVSATEMSRLGFPLTVERSIEIFSGVADEKLGQAVYREYGRHIADDEIYAMLNKARDAFASDLKSVDGIDSFLDNLVRLGVGKCIASNSLRENIFAVLNITGLTKHFNDEQIFDISLVKRGKPKPDIFLRAAREMQVDIKKCMVVEDSIVGIRAAKAANMEVVGFLGATHAKYPFYRKCLLDAGPSVVASNAAELLDLIMKKRPINK